MKKTFNEFDLAFRRCQDEGGHSYDAYTILMCYRDYENAPDKYDWLEPYYA